MADASQRLDVVNATRCRPGQQAGHYESFFQRANHPSRPLAFWIRYTIFSPEERPQDAVGELWAVFFDGETHQHVAVKKEVPFSECTFRTDEFLVRVAGARLDAEQLSGAIDSGEHALSWALTFSGEAEPLFLLPRELYETPFPQAKSLVGLPLAVYNGDLRVDGREIPIADWVGSQNHNWGLRHTDHYAWGQVAGFDNGPQTFLEVATARVRIGSDWSPFMAPVVLRRGTEDCLNTKIAACELRVTYRQPGSAIRTDVLSTRNRAAFEILTDDRDHGIAIRA